MAHTLARAAICTPRSTGSLSLLRTALATWRQRRALDRLDARAMNDLGLRQSEVLREANRPVWDVPQSWRA